MPDAPTPEMLKKMKLDSDSSAAGPSAATTITASSSNGASSSSKSGPKRAYVVDLDENEEEAEAGDFAPGGDADYFAEEDDEGRFFGGGLTSEQKEILNIFDNAGEGAPDDVRCLCYVFRQNQTTEIILFALLSIDGDAECDGDSEIVIEV